MNVPDGWRTMTLDEVGTWFGGGTPSKSRPEFWDGGTVPWLSPKDMGETRLSGTRDKITDAAVSGSAARMVPAGAVAFVVRSGILERALPSTLVSFPTTLNQDMKALVPHADIVTPEWLAHAFRAFEHPLLTGTRKAGTTVASLDFGKVKSFQLPVPPLPEQRRIVEIVEEQVAHLDAADASLASAERRLSALQDGVIRSAVLGQGSLGPHLPSPLEAVGTNDGELEPLPPGWRWARLHEVADVVGGVTKDAKKQDDPNYVAVPYLRVANVQRGSLNLDTVTTIRVAPHRAAALELKVGDVLLNEGGDRDKLARGWVWEGQIPACIHQNHVFRARVRDITIDPYFLSHAANAIGGKWAERNGKQTTNLASISLSMIKKMPVPVPPNGQSKKIASEIALRLEGLARQSDAISVAKRRSAVLRRAVLAAAFSGRLTTHTDAVGSLPGASADD